MNEEAARIAKYGIVKNIYRVVKDFAYIDSTKTGSKNHPKTSKIVFVFFLRLVNNRPFNFYKFILVLKHKNGTISGVAVCR